MTINERDAIAFIDDAIASTHGGYVESDINAWTPEEIRDGLAQVANVFQAVATTVQVSQNIVASIADAVIISRQIDALVVKVNADLEKSIVQIRASLPLIESQIGSYNDNLDRLMDELLAIDPANANEHVLRWRSQLIAMIMDKNDKIQQLLMTVLTR